MLTLDLHHRQTFQGSKVLHTTELFALDDSIAAPPEPVPRPAMKVLAREAFESKMTAGRSLEFPLPAVKLLQMLC